MSEGFYTRQGMTQAIAQALVDEHGTQTAAAAAIRSRSRNTKGDVPSATAVRQWIQEALSPVNHPIIEPSDKERLNQIKNLLDEANIPLDAIGKIDHVKVRSGFHEGLTKGEDGEPVVTRLRSKHASLVLSPKWAEGPAWPLVEPAKPTVVKYTAPTVIVPRGLRVEMIHPDTQGGFTRVLDSRTFDGTRESYELQSIHDEAAIDVALQITAAVQPDGFTHVGDILDLSEFSRYLQVEEFWRMTQPAIDWGHQYLANVKSAMGEPHKRNGKRIPKRYRLVDGNHDWKRMAEYIQKNARAAFGLRPAMTTPETWPDLSLPHLLRLDELGFEQCGMWPGSEAWLVEGKHALVVVHDPRKRGTFQASVIAGHTHHHRESAFTVRTPFGYQTFTLYEIGCLASLARSDDKGSIKRMRVPSDRAFSNDWVHGIAVVEILEDTGQHRVEFIPIIEGVAVYQRQRFEAKQVAKAA